MTWGGKSIGLFKFDILIDKYREIVYATTQNEIPLKTDKFNYI